MHLEHVHEDENGNQSKEEVHAFPLFDDKGRVTQVIQYCIDITEKKRLEAVAEAANLMENLGFIFSGICHEIGNPINSIKMALSVLSNNLENYSPDLEGTEQNINVLSRAIEIASDPVNQSGMKQVVVLFTPPVTQEGSAAIESLISQAKDNQVRL